ncbi:glycosyltransferase [Jeotgalibacillus sp. S-D1]|uniref:glycosyltransferase n=1 Tax=Jeotgalibacillus sp. S-D1 TaxID=2552189 RepID=UPI00105A06A9|nr:glycosyltransferase [Jeotgalibacillus sp. S-D1]TDL32836.1 glycosyltransferase [Jeotgalibacillus sp. S-D1]
MELVFVHSHIFKYDKNKRVYTDGKLTYQMWENRYLKHFDKLKVAARGVEYEGDNLNISSGSRVKHYILPTLSNVARRNKNLRILKEDLEKIIENADAVVARVPSGHAYHAIKIAKKLKKPYVIEVVGDVFPALWNHGKILGKIIAPIYYYKYRNIIKHSSYNIYVTEEYLQKKYPYNHSAKIINASNVEISLVPKEILEEKLRKIKLMHINQEYNIGLIGSYSSKQKGIDTAIKAIKNLSKQGIDCNLHILGDGDKSWLIELVKELNIEDKIHFSGSLPGGEKVFNWLDSMDIYIQPSLTEGLPRALIEAMSRGLPCVGSSVGGIPELIDKRFIHEPKSSKQLSDKIRNLLRNNQSLEEQSINNYNNAKQYTSEVLNTRRDEFWKSFINTELKKHTFTDGDLV